jgi:hypothetical protein
VRSIALCCIAVLAMLGCATAPPVDNPSAPRPMRSDAQQKLEARQLQQAEAKCVAEGKKAIARRVENSTVYECVAPAVPPPEGSQPPPKP